MLRKTMRAAIGRIRRDIVVSELYEAFDKAIDNFRERGKDDEILMGFLLQPLKQFAIAQSSYSDAENKVLEIFELSDLVSSSLWQRLLARQVSPSLIVVPRNNLKFFLDHAPRIIDLLSQEGTEERDSTIPHSQGTLPVRDSFVVTLVESPGQLSSPLRIIHLFEAVSGLYAALAALSGRSESDLALLSCDSGSDKLFDFQGSGEPIRELRKLAISIWENVVFHKHRKSDASLDLVSKSLPILAEISQMEADSKISKEHAEKLRRQILDSATKFIQVGAITEGMDTSLGHSPRQLMAPSQKLLAAPEGEADQNALEAERDAVSGQSNAEQDADDDDDDGIELSDEDIERYERAIKRRQALQKGVKKAVRRPKPS